MIIDTHAHLDDFVGKKLDEILINARKSNVNKIVSCSARPEDWKLYPTLAENYKNEIFWTYGLHPTECNQNSEELLLKWQETISSKIKPIAIGEIGLDFFRLPNEKREREIIISLQKKIFELQIDIAKDVNLPICIHARSAINECIEILKNKNFDFKKTVFHCFSGNVNDIKTLNSLGGRASFTGIITYKKADEMRATMLAQGLDRIMFETDCPYLSPEPFRGKINEPSNLQYIVRHASKLFNISEEKLADISTQNASEFFKI